MLLLFVYGTLKRGFRNHAAYCRGVVRVEEAAVHGRLYDTSHDYPVLVVPEQDILAIGTADPLTDVAAQDSAAAQQPAARFAPESGHADAAPTGWYRIRGELFGVHDPVAMLPALDELEEFVPGKASLYRRVLVPVQSGNGVVPAWTYAADSLDTDNLQELTDGFWPLSLEL